MAIHMHIRTRDRFNRTISYMRACLHSDSYNYTVVDLILFRTSYVLGTRIIPVHAFHPSLDGINDEALSFVEDYCCHCCVDIQLL
jgi:hypothetical protein